MPWIIFLHLSFSLYMLYAYFALAMEYYERWESREVEVHVLLFDYLSMLLLDMYSLMSLILCILIDHPFMWEPVWVQNIQ
jgi:hypothetical protein